MYNSSIAIFVTPVTSTCYQNKGSDMALILNLLIQLNCSTVGRVRVLCSRKRIASECCYALVYCTLYLYHLLADTARTHVELLERGVQRARERRPAESARVRLRLPAKGAHSETPTPTQTQSHLLVIFSPAISSGVGVQRKDGRFYPTPHIIGLVMGKNAPPDAAEAAAGTASSGYIVVETNYRLYAYTGAFASRIQNSTRLLSLC